MVARLKSMLWTWLPVVLWLTIIVFESSNMLSSSNTGSILYKLLQSVFGPINHHKFDIFHGVLRKVGHFVGYGILGILFFRAIRHTYVEFRLAARKTARQAVRRAANIAVICTAAVASLDELHQSSLPSRTGAFHDVILDTLGAVILLMIVLNHYSRTLHTTEAE